MSIFKVSYVIIGRSHPGTILNLDERPMRGQIINLGTESFEVVEVIDLMPPRGDFYFIHATCKPLDGG
jgi:hypothetical protein